MAQFLRGFAARGNASALLLEGGKYNRGKSLALRKGLALGLAMGRKITCCFSGCVLLFIEATDLMAEVSKAEELGCVELET